MSTEDFSNDGGDRVAGPFALAAEIIFGCALAASAGACDVSRRVIRPKKPRHVRDARPEQLFGWPHGCSVDFGGTNGPS